jgi:hypothetical protein
MSLRIHAARRLAEARQIKQGIMQELLTGKIRLPIDAERLDDCRL